MDETIYSFREVIPDQTASEKWVELTVNSGGTQSTLQDIKVAESTGGYCYKNQNKYYTRNRFIYWRIYQDVLELIEHSLDVNLTNNKLRLKFVDTPVLEGVSITEVHDCVFILVATVSSVHRLMYPHPDKICKDEHVYPRCSVDYNTQSIFADASLSDGRHFRHLLNTSLASLPLPHTSATTVSANREECLFAVAYSSGVILLVKLNSITTNIKMLELGKNIDSIIVPRFLSRAFRTKNNEDETAASIIFHTLASETYLLSLCRDGNVRLWSTIRDQSKIVTDIQSDIYQAGQSQKLKKAVTHNGDLLVSVSQYVGANSIIYILKPYVEDNNYQLRTQAAINTPSGLDLVDYSITPNEEVWCVFHSAQGETSVARTILNSSHLGWLPCVLESHLDRDDIPFDIELDVKQNYLQYIFQPGRFPFFVINKALSIYRKSNIVTDFGVSIQTLKERVSSAVDSEISMKMQENDCCEEDAVDVFTSCWHKFYSCCVEYYESGNHSLGLLLLEHDVVAASDNKSVDNESADMEQDDNSDMSEAVTRSTDSEQSCETITSGVVLIKKSYFSLLRPMDKLESVFYDQNLPYGDEPLTTDVINLLHALIFLDENTTQDFKQSLEKNLKQLKTPTQAVAELMAKELSIDSKDCVFNIDLLYSLSVKVDTVTKMKDSVTTLLDMLSFTVDTPTLDTSKWLLHLGHLYASYHGMSFVANTLQQIVKVRYDLSSSLLIFIHLLSNNSLKQFLPRRRFASLKGELTDRCCCYVQCYFVVMWVSTCPVRSLLLSADSLENSVSVLKLNENNKTSLFTCNLQHLKKNITLLQLFLQSSAAITVRMLLSNQDIPGQYLRLWQRSLLPFVYLLAQLIWPENNNSMFAEFLLTCNQHLHIQEYCRLLSKSFQQHTYTRKFMLACSLLDCCEHNKAYDMFNIASNGVLTEAFINVKILNVNGNLSKERCLVLYYLKVINLFEQQGLNDILVKLARQAITVADKHDPELPTLYSILFFNYLKLGQYEQAYDSLIGNPDLERRKDSLRQLVVNLFECGNLEILFNFKYEGMLDDFERIIQSRARSLDVMDHKYYDFLYSFHTLKGSMRKGACVMYEQAIRLSQSNYQCNINTLERQVRCYASTINSLSLVKSADAWIVKPLSPNQEDKINTTPYYGFCPKDLKEQVKVLELKHIKREYSLCRSKLKLIKQTTELTNKFSTMLTAHEVAGMLTNAGFYKDALHVCELFGIGADCVLAGLAGVCVSLDQNPVDTSWEWLTENDVTDFASKKPSDLAWNLLESFLNRYECDKSSLLHKAVANKLLHLGVFLPYWLLESYKTRNPTELVRLLLQNGRLEESAEVAVEYIEAMLGKGKERFGLEHSLLAQNPATWLPFNVIDVILLELEIHSNKDDNYAQLYNSLNTLLEKYLQTAVEATQDLVTLTKVQN